MMTTRDERLRALHALHSAWVGTVLDEDETGFHPDEHPEHSDYNLHTADIDADGAAEDEFATAAAEIMGGTR